MTRAHGIMRNVASHAAPMLTRPMPRSDDTATSSLALSTLVASCRVQLKGASTVRFGGIGTGISEASKRVPIFSFATQGGKQVSSYFRQGNSDKDTIKVYAFFLSKTHHRSTPYRCLPSLPLQAADFVQIQFVGRYRPILAPKSWPLSDIGRWAGHVCGQVCQILPLGSSHRLHPPVWAGRSACLPRLISN
jgi:hypothetical protein